MTPKIKYLSSLWVNLFSVVCFLPGLRIALASLGLRHAILYTAYKVTEAKTEIPRPQVLINKWTLWLFFSGKRTCEIENFFCHFVFNLFFFENMTENSTDSMLYITKTPNLCYIWYKLEVSNRISKKRNLKIRHFKRNNKNWRKIK